MALLITPTLLDSIDWVKKCPPSWKDRAYQSLDDTLNRRWNPSKAITRGINFEKQICHGANPVDEIKPHLRDKFNEAYKLIHAEGHDFQAKAKKIVEYNAREYCLYGRIDVNFPKKIIDIKTTGNYRGKQSYLSKWQHKFYTLLEQKEHFQYVVFEFGDDKGKEDSDAAELLVDIHIIDYYAEDFAAINDEIMAGIEGMANFLNEHALFKKAYLTKFNMYN